MVVKYGTSSANLVNKMEKDLIEHDWNSIANKVSGCGGPNGATGPYFLYVILK
jgi:nicotinamide mononucleotide (NMN) deamidase PncC